MLALAAVLSATVLTGGGTNGDRGFFVKPPLLAAAIAEHPTVREQFAARLVADGDLTPDEANELEEGVVAELRRAHEALKESFGQPGPVPRDDVYVPAVTGDEVVTAVAADRLRALNEQLLRVPDGFTPHAKLMRQLERRRETLAAGGIDWGQAEALAFHGRHASTQSEREIAPPRSGQRAV